MGQWGLAYLATAWLMAQVFALVGEQFAWSVFVLRGITVLLAFGLLPALVIAWYHGDRGEQNVGRGELALLTVLFAAGGTLVWWIARPGAPEIVREPPPVASDRAVRDTVSEPKGQNVLRADEVFAPPEHSIAVLPFHNLSDDPEQQYFVAGMHEALISELARIEDLLVISRTSALHYRQTTLTLAEIARELNVAMIIEGSVLKSANQVRVQIRLVGLQPERNLFAETYDRELSTVLALQSEITRNVASKIKVSLTEQEESRLAQGGSVQPDVYTAWLKGNFYLSGPDEESFTRAIEHYQEALDLDPRFAPAWAGLAMAYLQLGGWHASHSPQLVIAPARTAAEQALALDPELAAAHVVLGQIAAQFEWNWRAADQAFQRGAELNPSNTNARLEYANFLTAMGRFEESIDFGTQTLRLDPLSAGAYGELAFAYWLSGRDEEALALYREGLALDDSLMGHALIADVYMARGDVDEVLVHLAPFDQALDALSPAWLGIIGRLYALAGREDKARALLSDLKERRTREFIPAAPMVYIHLGLGETEEALRWLEVAYEERDVSLIWLKELHVYDSLRGDPRFQEILGRMNFPADT